MKTSELFTNKEKEKFAKKIKQDMKALDHLRHSINVLCSDYGLVEEENRVLKKHFNVTPEKYNEIEKKYIKRKSPQILSK